MSTSHLDWRRMTARRVCGTCSTAHMHSEQLWMEFKWVSKGDVMNSNSFGDHRHKKCSSRCNYTNTSSQWPRSWMSEKSKQIIFILRSVISRSRSVSTAMQLLTDWLSSSTHYFQMEGDRVTIAANVEPFRARAHRMTWDKWFLSSLTVLRLTHKSYEEIRNWKVALKMLL